MIPSVSALELSAALVTYLRGQGKTLREIGDVIGLSESFVSRVANGERSLTIDHLAAFERELGEPLPALVLQAMWGREVNDEQRPAFEEALRLLRELGGFRRSLELDASSQDREGVPAAGHRVRKASPKRRRVAG